MAKDDALALDAPDLQPAAAAAAVPEPTPFGAEDVVPRFRSDLHVRRGASPALFDVSDPRTGRKFTLYEFELAVARMLDGRRKVSEVVEAGGRLGVPMDATALYKFVRQMWHYGFLAPPAPAGADGLAEGGTWDSREPWGEETRALFQTGQRLMRLGRNADAASYFEAVLDGHPGNPEATELLAVIARGQSLAAAPLGERGPQAAPPAPPAPPADPGAATPAPPAPARGRSPWLALAAVTLLAAGGAAAFLLTRKPAAPPPPAPVAAPVSPLPAAPAPPAAAAPAWRTARVERRTHPPTAELVASAGGDFTWTAAADAEVAKGGRVGELRVEVAAGRKDAALAKRVAQLEALAAKDPVYRDFLDKARRDLRRAEAKRKTRPVPLLAPAAGLLARAPEAGGRAEGGERLARILDPSVWSLAATVDGPEPEPDAACEVVGDVPADRAPCRLASRSRAGERTEVLAEVTAAGAPWLARAGSLWLRVAPPGTPRTEPAAPAPAPTPQEPPR